MTEPTAATAPDLFDAFFVALINGTSERHRWVTPGLLMLIYQRLRGFRRRFASLARRMLDGTLAAPRPRAARPAKRSSDEAETPVKARRGYAHRLPRRWGWLCAFVPSVAEFRYSAAGFGLTLTHLLQQPSVVTLVLAEPHRMGRILRPLCQMLAVPWSNLLPEIQAALATPAPRMLQGETSRPATVGSTDLRGVSEYSVGGPAEGAISGSLSDPGSTRARAPGENPMVERLAMPVGTMPEGAMPEGAMPEGAMPEGAMPEGAMPEGAMPEGAMPAGETSAGAMPDGETLAGVMQEGAMPEGATSAAEETRAPTAPRDTSPPDTSPPDTSPPDTSPRDTAPPVSANRRAWWQRA